MTGLIIAMIFASVILLVLLSSLSVTLSINDKVVFRVNFLGICVFDINSKKKKNSSLKKKEKTSNKGLTDVLKEYAANKNNKELIVEIFSIFKELCIKFSKLLKHTRFKKLEVDFRISSNDAAKTAILYGNACSVVYSLVALLKSACNFDHKKIKVSADFSSETINLSMLCNIKIKTVYIVSFAISVFYSIIKTKLGEFKNGRTKHWSYNECYSW